MKFDFDKCPDCGYVNNNRPNICPSCGFNLLEYRTKLFLEKEKFINEKKKIEQEKELEEKLEANYKKAIDLLLSNNNKEGLELLKELGNYKDSLEYKEKCELIVYDNFIFDFNSVDLLKTLYNDKVIELNNGVPDTSEIKKYEQFIYRYITRNTFYEPVDIKDLIDKYTFIEEYRDTSLYLSICRYAIKLIEKYKEVKQEENYKRGVECFNQEKYDEAIKIFENLKYKDSSSLYEKAKILKEKKDYYLKGLDYYNNKKYSEALDSLIRSRNYKDSKELIEKIGKITRKKFRIFIVSIAIIVVLLITTFIIIGVIQN